MPVDPIEFGRLQATVESQSQQLDAMVRAMEQIRKDVHKLMAISERGKGALWMALTVGGVLGGFLNWLFTRGH